MPSAYHEMNIQIETFSFLQIDDSIKIQLESNDFHLVASMALRVKPKLAR